MVNRLKVVAVCFDSIGGFDKGVLRVDFLASITMNCPMLYMLSISTLVPIIAMIR